MNTELREISPTPDHILLPHQQRWVNDKSALKLWLAARQVGKSFALAMEAVTEALAVGPGSARCNNLILSSSERQSKEVMQKVFQHLRYLKVRSEDIIRAERETKEEVSLPNGSRIISLPANPDTVRGFSGNVFLDEFAFHKDSREIWKAMYPTVTRGYKVRITSTPNGKQNMFYELWNLTPLNPPLSKGGHGGLTLDKGGHEGWSRHKTDIYDAVSEGLKVDIDALRQGIGDPDSWAQEFECRFVDEATAFITYEMITACEDEGATKEFTPTLALPPQWGGDKDNPSLEGRDKGRVTHIRDYYLGVDIGRKRDLTVFWLWEKVGDVFWTRMVKEMRGATFSAQRDFLYGLMDGTFLNPSSLLPLDKGRMGGVIKRSCIDSSGIGAQLAEEAIEKFGSRIEAVTFTGPVKEDLAVTFRRKFEDRLVRLPLDREIREDIHSVKKSTTPAGNARFDAERTEQGHADRFWAGALGVHAGSSRAVPVEYESLYGRDFKSGISDLKFSGAGCW